MYGYPVLTIPLPADKVKSYMLKVNIPQSYTGPSSSDAGELGTNYTAYIPSDQVSTLASQIRSPQSNFYHGVNDTTAQQLAARVSSFSSTSSSDSTQAGNPRPSKMNVAIIVGATIGTLSLLTASVVIIHFIRKSSRYRLLGSDMEHWSKVSQQATWQDLHSVEPFTLKYSSIFASESQVNQAFPSDEKHPIPREEAETLEPLEASNPFTPLAVSRNTSVASSATASTTATIRQQLLHEQKQASAMQLASLAARISSSEWVSRAEYDALVVEMTRLRAEMSWIRDAQQSDWALGLSDEMPPPYSHSRVNSR
jgi:hypothetical protein